MVRGCGGAAHCRHRRLVSDARGRVETDRARRPGEHFAGDNSSPVPSAVDFDASREPKWGYVGTLDNDATTTEIRFLAKLASAAGGNAKGADARRKSYLSGIEYILAAQYPNGGWPQIWPLLGEYHDVITFNDDAMTKAMDVLLDAAEGRDEFAGVPAELRTRARAALAKGIETTLATQIVVGANPRRGVSNMTMPGASTQGRQCRGSPVQPGLSACRNLRKEPSSLPVWGAVQCLMEEGPGF